MSLVARLIDAGTPSDLVEEVAMLLAEKRVAEKAIAERREKDAERQARKRDREAGHVTSRDITGQDVTDDATPLSRPPNEEKSNPPTHTPGDVNTTRARNDPFPRPDWCTAQLWLDLKANRKAKRLPCTPTAHAKLLRDLDAMADDDWPPGRLLEAIVARGWAAAYDPRETRPNGNGHHDKPTTQDLGKRVAARFTAGGDSVADLVPRLGSPGWDVSGGG